MKPALESPRVGRRNRGVAVWLAAVTLAAASLPVSTSVIAQVMSEQQLIEALKGKGSRSLRSGPAAAAAQPAHQPQTADKEERLRALMDNLRKRGSRAFSAKERTEVAELVRERPNVDVEIYFGFNSSSVARQAVPTLTQIGKAMTNVAFQKTSFLITGHTDAKGKAEVNLLVSQRRAEAVKAYLVRQFNIDPARLQVLGYGEERLKNAARPFAGENRRVQIVNLPDGTLTASR